VASGRGQGQATVPAKTGAVPVRYMGTKRALAPAVRDIVQELAPAGQAADLFSGMGSVASALAPATPVLTNDVLRFTTPFARCRFLPSSRTPTGDVARELFPAYQRQLADLRANFSRRVRAEERAASGSKELLGSYFESSPHVGRSRRWRRKAQVASGTEGSDRYSLATLYFSGGYFSTQQAIELDALRYAIDLAPDSLDQDWLLSGWLSAASAVINAPGHTAQFLKPTNDAIHKRILRQWSRRVWPLFLERLDSLPPVGTKHWRAKNTVTATEARDVVASDAFDSVGLTYADPPYTKDHYSRYYHVYETLYLYDFPGSSGTGRYRDDRFVTDFSIASKVREAFESLFEAVSERGVPLILSYPSNGLLEQRHNGALAALLGEFFTVDRTLEFELDHSTLGASSGTTRKAALERIYVCLP
jgi:adenine-specific DNA-methyltransferase